MIIMLQNGRIHFKFALHTFNVIKHDFFCNKTVTCMLLNSVHARTRFQQYEG